MGLHSFMIGCVGKPSAGKSTFFNAVSEGKTAKVGAYNVVCKPRYGTCRNGRRTVPIKLLDVAGLIPGASEGLGLGNKFLDDLRQADVLLHILDISGTTNEKGENTIGYDPSHDHEWLLKEIELWIFHNLWNRWSSIARRHLATKCTASATLLSQLSGYGAQESLIQNVLNELGVGNSTIDFMNWDKEQVMNLVGGQVQKAISSVREPTLIETPLKYRKMMASALAECFLKKMRDQKYISYQEGDMLFQTAEDDSSLNLKVPDPQLQHRLERVRDMVLFRLGSTGVAARAVELAGRIPVFPIKNLQNLGTTKGDAFPECTLVKAGTTVRQFAQMLHAEIDRDRMDVA